MRRNLDGLLFPRSVAVIGASATRGRKSRARSSSPTSRAFPGRGLRREPQIPGNRGQTLLPHGRCLSPSPWTWRSVVIPAEGVAQVLRECGKKGIKERGGDHRGVQGVRPRRGEKGTGTRAGRRGVRPERPWPQRFGAHLHPGRASTPPSLPGGALPWTPSRLSPNPARFAPPFWTGPGKKSLGFPTSFRLGIKLFWMRATSLRPSRRTRKRRSSWPIWRGSRTGRGSWNWRAGFPRKNPS
jgi:hypothetical protein